MQEKNKYRYTEKCLYEYKRNLSAINVLREDLRVERAGTDVHVQNYQLSFGFNGEPDTLTERIQRLERYTQPVTQLIADLNAPENLKNSENKMLLDILKLLYFGKNTVEDILYEMHIGRRTFTRKRRQLVLMALGYLAL